MIKKRTPEGEILFIVLNEQNKFLIQVRRTCRLLRCLIYVTQSLPATSMMSLCISPWLAVKVISLSQTDLKVMMLLSDLVGAGEAPPQGSELYMISMRIFLEQWGAWIWLTNWKFLLQKNQKRKQNPGFVDKEKSILDWKFIHWLGRWIWRSLRRIFWHHLWLWAYNVL